MGEPGFAFGGRRWVASLTACRIKKGATGDKTSQPGNSFPPIPDCLADKLGASVFPWPRLLFIDSQVAHALPSRGMNPIIPVLRGEPFDHPGWAFELKLDGFRCIADTLDGRLLDRRRI